MARRQKRDKPVDVIFVLDATSSSQCVFTAMINHAESIVDDLNLQFKRALIYCGAVIYRDPVDYSKSPPETDKDPESRAEIERYEAEFRAVRLRIRKEKGIYNEAEELKKEERRKLFDNVKYPENINVAIDLVADTDKLITELEKIECKSGHDEQEDWAGALDIALNDISWRNESKKLIVWIADANAHGKRYCGVENHQEEESKLEPLVVKMARSNIYFIGINIRKGKDSGCQMTLQEMKKIYQRNGGKSFNIETINVSLDPDMDDDDIPPGFLNDFKQTVANTIRREFPHDFLD